MSDSNATKNALAASMKKLMKQKPFEKISVSDICLDCGINRKSFYYHFRDKYDLVNWIFDVGFISQVNLDEYQSGWDWLKDICAYFYRERDFYRAALRIEGQNSFRDYLVDWVKPVAEFFLADILPHNGDDDFYLAFIMDALMSSLVRWLSGGYQQEMDAQSYVGKLRMIISALPKVAEEDTKPKVTEDNTK